MERVRRNVMLSEESDKQLDELCKWSGRNRGRLLDLLIAITHKSYKAGSMHCITGDLCKLGIVELPTDRFK